MFGTNEIVMLAFLFIIGILVLKGGFVWTLIRLILKILG